MFRCEQFVKWCWTLLTFQIERYNIVLYENKKPIGKGKLMLKLTDIVKNYPTGNTTVHALKGVSLEFRESEFVAILGHSGCGKTTLLNIIGGLDHYTSGDLIVNGKSTKNFTDGDWDSYRNHSIGFVFQNYNLIPHQTVLSNVELALTLSGVGKAERRERAIKVLEQVGLGDQIHKKPNQMSGGQMQRVAIARALVNDPDILLADEPTGALDSETSIQIMEILKKISKDKLVIMVTHNPELADLYASRIVKLQDGLIMSDSQPYTAEVSDVKDTSKQKKTFMSFKTALSLSLNNLMTKKGRTILTAFAGSIGIIGIALILSLSNGIQTYIDKVQEDTLSSYPITIEAERVDMSNLVNSMMSAQAENSENKHDRDKVYSSTIMYDLINSLVATETEKNNLTAFKEYIDNPDSEINQYVSAIGYSYDLDLNVYAKDEEGKIIKSDITELLETVMSSMYGGDYSSYFNNFGNMYSMMNVWDEMLPGENGELVNEVLMGQYDVVYGRWPESYDEVVLIMDSNNEISDMVLYSLGLESNTYITTNMQELMDGQTIDSDRRSWEYDEICDMTFKVVLDSEYYQYDTATGKYSDVSQTDTGLDFLYNSDSVGTKIKVVGIIRPNDDAVSTMMSGAIGYTAALTDYLIEKTENMDIVKAQLEDKDTDVISGLPFLTDDYTVSDEEKIADIKNYVSGLSAAEKASIYTAVMSRPDDAYLNNIVEQQMSQLTTDNLRQMVLEQYTQEMGVDQETVQSYVSQMDDETLMGYVKEAIKNRAAEQYASGIEQQLGHMTTDQLAAALDNGSFSDEQWLYMYDEYMPATVSESTYEDNLDLLGYVDLASPSEINIYASTFEAKDSIAQAIENYNSGVSEEDKIDYTDYIALLMSSITTIINAISYALIAFVAISLVVSSIMIGIITYISVLERTKEIGILRAIGASKKDISRVFNAETLIEGFVSGAMGIIVTLILIVPINMVIHKLTGIAALSAALPPVGAVILVIISMVLTFIAGLIPSGIAAKKDPVEALRTE